MEGKTERVESKEETVALESNVEVLQKAEADI